MAFFVRSIDQSFWFDCFGFIKKFVFITLCDITNMSNIYEFVNFVFVPLCDVTNISICDYFDFRFFF